MNTAQALSKLRKLLGPKAEIQDCKRPSSEEQRIADRTRRHELKLRKDDAESRMKARRAEILNADPAYQTVKNEFVVLSKELDTIPHCHYRYEALTNEGWFRSVKAQGDTLDELVSKVEENRVKA